MLRLSPLRLSPLRLSLSWLSRFRLPRRSLGPVALLLAASLSGGCFVVHDRTGKMPSTHPSTETQTAGSNPYDDPGDLSPEDNPDPAPTVDGSSNGETPAANPDGDTSDGEAPTNDANPEPGADDDSSASGDDGDSSDTTENANGDADNEDAEIQDADIEDAKNENANQENSDQPELKTERLVLFTSAGPLLIDVRLAIDGQRHDLALGKLVDYVLEEADTDGDGKATWEELTENSKFMYGQLGNAELTSAAMRRSAIELYDVIRNGRVDASEVPRFLTRNSGGSRSFDFRSANYYRDINRSDSAVLRLLDANYDGRVDMDEAERAAVRLQSRDADGDGILLLDELEAATDDRPGPLNQRRVAAPSSSAWLNAKTKWANVLFAMEEQYALGGALQADAFNLDPRLFKFLNTDDDDRIDNQEIARLLEAEPHLHIAARFGERDESQSALELIRFDPWLEQAGGAAQVAENRITLRLPKDHLLIFFKDEAQAARVEQQAAALLNQYDADNNKYLDEDEFPEAAPGLMGGIEAYDEDGDGKVYEPELKAYLANVRVAQRSQIHSRAGDLSDAFFDAVDLSRDGRLDGRELDSLPETIKQLDADGDGELVIDELPGTLALGLVRGDPQQMDMLFSIPVARPAPPENAPRWFLRMDRNRDGVIARAEFLGETPQFDSLDVNQDGFLAANEVESE